jgi:hypothetical protein
MAALFVVEPNFPRVRLDFVLAEQVVDFLPPAFAMPFTTPRGSSSFAAATCCWLAWTVMQRGRFRRSGI